MKGSRFSEGQIIGIFKEGEAVVPGCRVSRGGCQRDRF